MFKNIKAWLKEAWQEWNGRNNLEQAEIFSGFVAGVVTLSTIISALNTYIYQQNNAAAIATRNDLSTDANYGKFLEKYRNNIQPKIANYLSGFEVSYTKIDKKDLKNKQVITVLALHPPQIKDRCQKNEIESEYCDDNARISEPNKNKKTEPNKKIFYFKIQKNPSPDLYDENININVYKEGKEKKRFDKSCQALLNSRFSNTGIELFYSSAFDDFREIHNFFESLGFAIKNKSIQFDTVFNIFTYPANWTDGEKPSRYAAFDPFFEIETCVRKHWFGVTNKDDDKSLPDFSDNFLQLGTNYHYARVINKYNSLNCKLWWEFWKQDPKKKNENTCKQLSKIKNKIEEDYIENDTVVRQLYDSPNIWVSINKSWMRTPDIIKNIIIGAIIIIILASIIGWVVLKKTYKKNKFGDNQENPP